MLDALVHDICRCTQIAGTWAEAVATTVPSDATRLTELFFPPPTIARKSERVGVRDGEACCDGGVADGVTVAARGTTVLHAVNKTTTNSNRPINIQNAG